MLLVVSGHRNIQRGPYGPRLFLARSVIQSIRQNTVRRISWRLGGEGDAQENAPFGGSIIASVTL